MGADGAAVNLGRRNSVATRMLEATPFLLPIHCIAHRLELGVLAAIKNEPMLATVTDMLNKIHKHYHYSPKALCEFRAIAEAMDEHVLKPVRLAGTRWLPHMSKALDVLLQDYVVIRSLLEHVSQGRQGTAEVTGRATFLVNKLKDFRVLKFMFLLLDILASLKAQSNYPTKCHHSRRLPRCSDNL